MNKDFWISSCSSRRTHSGTFLGGGDAALIDRKCLDLFMLNPLLLCSDVNRTFSMIDEMYYGIGVPVGVPNRTTQGKVPGFANL